MQLIITGHDPNHLPVQSRLRRYEAFITLLIHVTSTEYGKHKDGCKTDPTDTLLPQTDMFAFMDGNPGTRKQ